MAKVNNDVVYVKDYTLPFFGNINFPKVSLKNKERAYNNYIAEDLCKSIRIFKWKGRGIGTGPEDTVPPNQIEKIKQNYGYNVVFLIDNKPYCVWAGQGGRLDQNGYPTEVTVNIPYLNYSKTLTVNKDCVVMWNDSFGLGLSKMFGRYAARRIETEISILLLSIKMRDTSTLAADDDKTLKSIEKYLQDLEEGKLGAIADSKFWEGLKALNTASMPSNSITQLIELEQYLKASKDAIMGLNGNFNMKRESITASESNLNEDSLLSFIDDMIECNKENEQKLKEVLGLDWTFDVCGEWEVKEAQREAEIDILNDMVTEGDIEAVEDVKTDDNINDTPDVEEATETKIEGIEEVKEDV